MKIIYIQILILILIASCSGTQNKKTTQNESKFVTKWYLQWLQQVSNNKKVKKKTLKKDNYATVPVDLSPHIKPQYTEYAHKNKIEGTVVLELIISDDGKVLRVRIAKGIDKGLNESAKKCYMKKKFKPSTLNGKRITVKLFQPVKFKLN